nr:YfbM family protein [uncultured Acetatifactor sp.]
MGLIGIYIAIENFLLSQIINGEKSILEIDPTQCQPLDVDKSWQAIHYLLCKDIENGKPPMGYVVPIRDDNELDCELDFGAFYITAQQVKEATNFLNLLDDNVLENMYDFKSMQQNAVYPLHGKGNEMDTGGFYEYIYSYLIKLREYFNQTAEKGYAIILYFS